MKLLEHDKKYSKDLNIEKTIVKLSLDSKNKLDNIIYYLICAQEKFNSDETLAGESRVDYAYNQLSKFIKEM